MKEVNFNDRESFFASDLFFTEAKETLANETHVVNLSYTDYGGTLLDKVLIAFLKEKYTDNIIFEKTSWNGENAFVFGNVAKEIIKNRDSLFSEFYELEDFYVEFEDTEYEKEAVSFMRDNGFKKRKDDIIEWLTENGRVETFGVDYSESELIKFLKTTKKIKS